VKIPDFAPDKWGSFVLYISFSGLPLLAPSSRSTSYSPILSSSLDRKNGRPDYGKMIVSGHSQGAGHAPYIASKFMVQRVVVLTKTPSGIIGTYYFVRR
jgi:hypothetical protein